MSAPNNEKLIYFVLLTTKRGKRPLSELTLQTEKQVSMLQNNKINVYWGPAELTAMTTYTVLETWCKQMHL